MISSQSQQAPPPSDPQPRIPILIHLRTPNNLQPNSSVLLQPRTPSQPVVAQFWPISVGTPAPPETPPEDQTEVGPQTTRPEEQSGTRSRQSGASTHFIQSQDAATPLTEPHPPAPQPQSENKRRSRKSSEAPSQHLDRPPAKQRRTSKADPGEARGSSSGLDPVVAPSTKPWPVFTIADSALGQPAHPDRQQDR